MWAELLSSVLGGGITGLAGSIVTKVAEHKTKKLELEAADKKAAHEIAMRKVDAELMAQEWAGRTKVAATEAAGKEAVADAQAFAASFNEPARYSEGVKPTAGQGWALIILDLVRGVVRPALTIYLCAITTVIYLQARELAHGANIDPKDALAMVNHIVATILYLTVTVVCWWFGTRQKNAATKS